MIRRFGLTLLALSTLVAVDAASQSRSGRDADNAPRFQSLKSDNVHLRVGPGTQHPIEWVLQRRNLPVRDGFTIGRVAPADLVIDDSKASRRHARIVVDNGVVEIEDLGSSNGTLLNGKPVTRRVLRGGDQLQIGKTVFTFREGEVPGGSAPKAAGACRCM